MRPACGACLWAQSSSAGNPRDYGAMILGTAANKLFVYSERG